ncbi:MAG: ice-binding family protein [Fibrobacteria bacterium]
MKNLTIPSFLPVSALAASLLLTFSLIGGTAYGSVRTLAATGSDTTGPGAGTGLSGAGKGPAPVLLGKSGDYVILAKTGISATGTTAVTGDIGVSPEAASAITGFSLLAPPSDFSSSSMVTGKIYAADYDSPTPANLTTAVLDMMTAYTDAAGRAPDYSELKVGEIGGMTLAPAVYRWGTDVLATSDFTLSGGSKDVWIFQVAGNLTLGAGVSITLSGGALPENIFWQVAGAVDQGTTSHFEGIILCQTGITLKTDATANGRQLAQTAVILDANTVMEPSAASVSMARSRSAARVSQGIRLIPMGGLLAMDVGFSSRVREVSIIGADGKILHRVTIPANKSRAMAPVSPSRAKGLSFRIK